MAYDFLSFAQANPGLDNSQISQAWTNYQLSQQANALPKINTSELWDSINSQKDWLGNVGDLSWNQLTPADQVALSGMLSSNPYQVFQNVAGHSILTPSAISERTVGDQVTQEVTPFGQRTSAYFGNYYAPTQTEMLYRLSPEIAAKYGITAETVAQDRALQDSIAKKIDSKQMRAMDREALAMAATVLSAGMAGNAMGLGAAEGGSAYGALGDIAASSGGGYTAGAGSIVGPATGADASVGANGAVVSAAPGTSTAGITTADLAAFGGTSGAAGGAAVGSGGGTTGSSAGSTAAGSTGAPGGSSSTSSGLLSADNAKLVSAAAGGLLGNTGGSKQAGTTTTTTAPWTSQQPYLLDVFKQAKAASQGSPITQQANKNYQSVLSGPTSNPMLGLNNPYLQQSIDYANQDVNRAFMPAMTAANRSSGSYGNSGIADTYSKNMLDAYGRNATTMRMQDYTQQQNLQQQAVNNTLNYTQNANQWNAEPSKLYGQTVQGSYGGTTSTPYYDNKYANILGGITTGLGLYNALSGSK